MARSRSKSKSRGRVYKGKTLRGGGRRAPQNKFQGGGRF